jgi:hypothetical protein
LGRAGRRRRSELPEHVILSRFIHMDESQR